MLSGVKGRIVIVTGGASGMGAACARLLSGAGARVVIVDRDGVGAANVAAGIGATVVAGDVTDSAFCDHAVAETLERHGRAERARQRRRHDRPRRRARHRRRGVASPVPRQR